MKILKSILNYIPLATFIIFVVTDGIFSLTSALIFVISTIGLLINCKRKKQRWRIEKIPVCRIKKIGIYHKMRNSWNGGAIITWRLKGTRKNWMQW